MTTITENITVEANITRKQRVSLMNVIDNALLNGHYEIKEFRTHQYDDGDLRVTIETGLPNDEGTMAAILCRYLYMFTIGRQGGIYKYVKNSNGEYVKKYYKYYRIPNEF